MSVLHEPCKTGNIEEVRSLINLGTNIGTKTSHGSTPLHFASRYGHVDIVKLLIDSGADIQSRDNSNWTSLHYASCCEHIDIVKLLIDSGPSCMAAPVVRPGADIEAKDNHGRTPKQITNNKDIIAVFECYEHMIQLKEWRPWNHSKYPIKYRQAMQTLVLLV